MTRLITYLNENNNVELLDEVIEKLKSDCSIYLNDIKRQDNILLSGRNSKEKFFERDVRKNRTPRDTPIEIHTIFDNHFQKKTGIRLRSNSLFCVSGRNTAGAYGDVYYIFPIGKYQT